MMADINDETRALIRQMKSEGRTIKQISEDLSVSSSEVFRHLPNSGIPTSPVSSVGVRVVLFGDVPVEFARAAGSIESALNDMLQAMAAPS
jgi:hypothetical protein